MSDDYAAPAAPSAGITYADLSGRLLLINVLSYEDHVQTVHTEPGEKNPALRADVTVLDGPEAGKFYEDALIFPKVLVSQCRTRIGKLVLGRLYQGAAKPGRTAPWMLAEATDADKRLADEHRARTATPTYAAPATQSQAPF